MSEEHLRLLIKAGFENLNTAAQLLDDFPSLIDEKTSLGETALHYLAVENQLEAVRFLYQRGANINTANNCGGTPLSEAASLGYVELVKFLLEKGARTQGLFGTGDPILHEAVRSGNPDIIDLLVRNGADIHSKNSLGESALHESTKDDKWLEVTKYLIAHGAAIDGLADFESTPLHGAALYGAINTTKYLIQSGATTSLKDSQGRTAAQVARESYYLDLASLLEETEHI
jgi:ankyrin repeat protein